MAIGNRPYEVVDDPHRIAEGPPYLQATVLLCDFAYELLPVLQQWGLKLDAASGEHILVVMSGESSLSGAVYRKLRTKAKSQSDDEEDRLFRNRIRAAAEPARASTQLNTDNAHGTAERLGVVAHQLPCIVWSTYPDIRPPLITPIKEQWCLTAQARQQFSKVLVSWFWKASFRKLMKGGQSVGALRKSFSAHVTRLLSEIDEAVGSTARNKSTRKSPKIIARLRLVQRDEQILFKRIPATLEFIPAGGRRNSEISTAQFFYLTAFINCGKRHGAATDSQIRVTERILADRIQAWIKAGLRQNRATKPQDPRYQITKDWKGFASEMNDRFGSNEWFEESVAGKKDSNRYYACSNESVILTMDSKDRIWLREQLLKLTKQF